MIQQVTNINNSDLVAELKAFPNQAFIWEIIEGKPSGKIYQLAGGAILIMENCSDPFIFIVGNLTEAAFAEVLSILKNKGSPMVYCNPLYHQLFLAEGWNFNLRVELHLKKLVKPKTFDTTLEIKKIDNHDLFKKCFWYNTLSELYGGADNFLEYGSGLALCLDDQVLSEAYDTAYGGYVECSVATHLESRKKGYALQIIAALLEKYEGLDLIPVWSCDVDNKASLYTGLKLGFEPKSYYVWMVPDF